METQKALEVLGITGDVNADTVKSAYVRLVKKYHPDLAKSEADRVSYTRIIIDVNDAYSTLRKALRDGDIPKCQQHDTDQPHTEYKERTRPYARREEHVTFDAYRARMQSISEFIKTVPDVSHDEVCAATWHTKVIDMIIQGEADTLSNKQRDMLWRRAKSSPSEVGVTDYAVFDHGYDERHDGMTADDYVSFTSKTCCGYGDIKETASWVRVLYDVNVKRYYWCNADFSNLTPPTPTIEDVTSKRQMGFIIPERNSMNAVSAPKPPKKERRSPLSVISSFFRR